MKVYLLVSISIISVSTLIAQRQIQVNGFGHLGYENNFYPNDSIGQDDFGSFTLGEHDLFVSGKLSDKVSFLGEFVFKGSASSPSGFLASIERARIRYNYHKKHYLLVGKMHTALNYWNDVYHHGRIFFPTIDRPLNFSFFVPIHSLGIRLQGQDIGKYKFGYDVQVANGMESTDISSSGFNFSYNASVHIKPKFGTRLMAGFNNDFLPTNTHGPHAHAGSFHNHMYKGSVSLNQFHVSVARFQTKFELLNEFAIIGSRTDSLGLSVNYTNYIYAGYRIKEKYIPYVMLDALITSDKELHTRRMNALKYSLGFRWEFSDKLNLKVQFEKYGGLFEGFDNIPMLQEKYELKMQLSYAI